MWSNISYGQQRTVALIDFDETRTEGFHWLDLGQLLFSVAVDRKNIKLNIDAIRSCLADYDEVNPINEKDIEDIKYCLYFAVAAWVRVFIQNIREVFAAIEDFEGCSKTGHIRIFYQNLESKLNEINNYFNLAEEFYNIDFVQMMADVRHETFCAFMGNF